MEKACLKASSFQKQAEQQIKFLQQFLWIRNVSYFYEE